MAGQRPHPVSSPLGVRPRGRRHPRLAAVRPVWGRENRYWSRFQPALAALDAERSDPCPSTPPAIDEGPGPVALAAGPGLGRWAIALPGRTARARES